MELDWFWSLRRGQGGVSCLALEFASQVGWLPGRCLVVVGMLARVLAEAKAKRRRCSTAEQSIVNDVPPIETTASSSSVIVDAVEGVEMRRWPPRPRKSSWWESSIRHGSAPFWRALESRQLVRSLTCDSLCTNLGAELSVFEQLGLPVERIQCCDILPVPAHIALCNYRSRIDCYWKSIADHSRRSGSCYAHSNTCKRSVASSKGLLIVGPPCQPYSELSGSGTPANQHPLFESLFGRGRHGGLGLQRSGDSVLECVAATCPRAVMLEQVTAFAYARECFGGRSALDLLVDDFLGLRDEGGGPLHVAYHVFDLDAASFGHMSRSRKP